jgi:hypothetical protein
MSKPPQPQQTLQLTQEAEALLDDAYKHMPAEFERHLIEQKLQGPPGH